MEITVDMTVIPFNSGYGAWRGLLEWQCGLGPTLLMFFDSKDELRMWMAEYKQKQFSQDAQERDTVGQGDP